VSVCVRARVGESQRVREGGAGEENEWTWKRPSAPLAAEISSNCITESRTDPSLGWSALAVACARASERERETERDRDRERESARAREREGGGARARAREREEV